MSLTCKICMSWWRSCLLQQTTSTGREVLCSGEGSFRITHRDLPLWSLYNFFVTEWTWAAQTCGTNTKHLFSPKTFWYSVKKTVSSNGLHICENHKNIFTTKIYVGVEWEGGTMWNIDTGTCYGGDILCIQHLILMLYTIFISGKIECPA